MDEQRDQNDDGNGFLTPLGERVLCTLQHDCLSCNIVLRRVRGRRARAFSQRQEFLIFHALRVPSRAAVSPMVRYQIPFSHRFNMISGVSAKEV